MNGLPLPVRFGHALTLGLSEGGRGRLFTADVARVRALDPRNDLRPTSRQLFAKISYAFQR